MIDLQRFQEKATSRKKSINKTFQRLKKEKPKVIDELFHEEHDNAFEEIDCLTCANCCKTTGPLFTDKDIERLSGHLRMKPSQFVEQYLRIDEDNDYVLQQVPCPFLGEDNYCSVYESRPKACREYPHTDRKNMHQILSLTKKNVQICPAVLHVVEAIEERINNKK
tara:strand:- start:1289 stop:1786 length:498 start_codon:yes stop_codon:yes gene_type:complete